VLDSASLVGSSTKASSWSASHAQNRMVPRRRVPSIGPAWTITRPWWTAGSR